MERLMLVVWSISLAGCGAVFNGGPQAVNFTSQPAGAEVWIDGQSYGTTPVAVELPKNKNHVVEFRLEGHETVTATLNRQMKEGYVILDVLGGPLPVVVDAVTGSWYGLDKEAVHGTLTPAQLEGLREEAGAP